MRKRKTRERMNHAARMQSCPTTYAQRETRDKRIKVCTMNEIPRMI